MLIVGIDPGAKGGWAWNDGVGCDGFPLPWMGKLYDILGLLEDIEVEIGGAPDLTIVEHQQGQNSDGIKSLNTLLPAYGQLIGALMVYRWKLVTPKPTEWKPILAGTRRDKQAAIDRVLKLWPNVDMTPGRMRKPHDGIADACCIAEWGQHRYARS